MATNISLLTNGTVTNNFVFDWTTKGTAMSGTGGGFPCSGSSYGDLPQFIIDWVAAHPYQAAFYIVNGVAYVNPAASAVPFLRLLGFGANGPVVGSWAAKIMSTGETVPAGGVFAHLQSAAMGGYGKAVVEGVVRAGVVVNGAVGALSNIIGKNDAFLQFSDS